MKIGEIVTVTGKMVQSRIYGGARIVIHTPMNPRRAVYLGKTIIYEGDTVYGDEYSNYFKPTARIPVLVFQPLQNSGERYLKPFYALPDDVSLENDN